MNSIELASYGLYILGSLCFLFGTILAIMSRL